MKNEQTNESASHGGDEVGLDCPLCDRPTTYEWHVRHFQYGVDDNATNISVRLPMYCCTECDMQFSSEEGERLQHEAVCRHLGLLSPREIRSIRVDRNLSREKFSEMTGLGVATLARWEKGIGLQNQANDRYLRLLRTSYGMSRLEKLCDESSILSASTGPPDEARRHERFRLIVPDQTLQQAQDEFELRRVSA